MAGAAWVLESLLVLLLGATLFHALRLERALGVLKRDRAVLEELVEGFNDSTRQAETGVERLRAAADGAGRQMARQIETAQRLRDDLSFLSDRSEKLAERLEGAVRAARMLPEATLLHGMAVATAPAAQAAPNADAPPHRPRGSDTVGAPQALVTRDAERVASALIARQHDQNRSPATAKPQAMPPATGTDEPPPRLRSQAERDLLRALRGSR